MGPRTKREYIETIFLRYRKASIKEKTTLLRSAPVARQTVILNEFCATCGFHRKHPSAPEV